MAEDGSESDEPIGIVDVDFSDEEWDDANELDATPQTATTAVVQPRRSARVRGGNRPDYVNERCDQEFSDCKGYSHFGRTRKGGDNRPNSKAALAPKKTRSSVTMLNYFATPGKRPRPIPRVVVDLTSKESTAGTSPQTRTRWGRPPKCSSKTATIVSLKKRVQRTATAGTLSVAPTPRRKWNGTVRLNVNNCSM